MSNNDLGAKLTELADNVLEELLEPGNDVPLAQKIDALRVIGTWHLGVTKARGKVPDEEDPAGSLPAMRERLRVAGE